MSLLLLLVYCCFSDWIQVEILEGLLIWQVLYSENSSRNPPGSDWNQSEPVEHSKDLNKTGKYRGQEESWVSGPKICPGQVRGRVSVKKGFLDQTSPTKDSWPQACVEENVSHSSEFTWSFIWCQAQIGLCTSSTTVNAIDMLIDITGAEAAEAFPFCGCQSCWSLSGSLGSCI